MDDMHDQPVMSRADMTQPKRARRLRRRAPALAATLLAATATGVALTATPAAAVPQTTRHAASSAIDSTTNKDATVSCPAGTHVVGTGGRVDGAPGHARVYQIAPNATLDQVTVRAVEHPAGTAANWSVTAFAVCTSMPLPGLERHIGASAYDSASFKSATATCSPGKTLLGTAAVLSGGSRGVVLDDILPMAALDSVRVWAAEGPGGTADSWVVRAVAICADVNPLTTFVERVDTATPWDSVSGKVATASCRDGWTLTGTGFAIDNGGGAVMVDDLTPDGTPAVSPSSTTVLAFEDPAGLDENWRVTAYAICVRTLGFVAPG